MRRSGPCCCSRQNFSLALRFWESALSSLSLSLSLRPSLLCPFSSRAGRPSPASGVESGYYRPLHRSRTGRSLPRGRGEVQSGAGLRDGGAKRWAWREGEREGRRRPLSPAVADPQQKNSRFNPDHQNNNNNNRSPRRSSGTCRPSSSTAAGPCSVSPASSSRRSALLLAWASLSGTKLARSPLPRPTLPSPTCSSPLSS